LRAVLWIANPENDVLEMEALNDWHLRRIPAACREFSYRSRPQVVTRQVFVTATRTLSLCV